MDLRWSGEGIMSEPYVRVRTSVHPVSRQAIVAMVLLTTAVVLLWEALASSDRPTRAVVWGGLALAAYATGLLCLVGAGQGVGLELALWRLGPWVLVWYALAYGLAATTWSRPQVGTTFAMITISNVLRALWLVAIGMTAWALGYFVGPGCPTQRLVNSGVAALGRRFGSEVRSPATPWVLYAIGSIARVAGVATTGRFGYLGQTASAASTASGYQQLLSMLSLCAPLALAAAALQVFRERLPMARITLTVLLLIELAVSAGSGIKANFLMAVLAVIVPWSAARGRLPKSLTAGATLVFLVIVIPFYGAYRSTIHGGSTTLTSMQAIRVAPDILRETVTGNDIGTALSGSFDYLLQRLQDIDDSAIILQETPSQFAYLSPAQLVETPLSGLVPRAIWHNKPIYDSMYQVSQEYYDQPASVYTAAGITPVGDLYRYGGWIPVIVGMFILGCGVRLFDNAMNIRENPHSIFLVLILFPAVVVAESGWVSIFTGITSTLSIWLLSVAITFRARRSA
jgi:hypothetical protein